MSEGHTKKWKTGQSKDISSVPFLYWREQAYVVSHYSLGCTTLISDTGCGSSHC